MEGKQMEDLRRFFLKFVERSAWRKKTLQAFRKEKTVKVKEKEQRRNRETVKKYADTDDEDKNEEWQKITHKDDPLKPLFMSKAEITGDVLVFAYKLNGALLNVSINFLERNWKFYIYTLFCKRLNDFSFRSSSKNFMRSTRIAVASQRTERFTFATCRSFTKSPTSTIWAWVFWRKFWRQLFPRSSS